MNYQWNPFQICNSGCDEEAIQANSVLSVTAELSIKDECEKELIGSTALLVVIDGLDGSMICTSKTGSSSSPLVLNNIQDSEYDDFSFFLTLRGKNLKSYSPSNKDGRFIYAKGVGFTSVSRNPEGFNNAEIPDFDAEDQGFGDSDLYLLTGKDSFSCGSFRSIHLRKFKVNE